MEGKDSTTESMDATNARPDKEIEFDIEEGKKGAKKRIAEITTTGELSQAKSKCKKCPADIGIPFQETANIENINIQYQIRITGSPCGPGWVQTWLFASVSFDGFYSAGCLLQEAKGRFDQFFYSDTQVQKWWSGTQEMVMQAVVQNAVVVATPPDKLNWYFMQPMSYGFFSRLFSSLGLSMQVIYSP